MPRVLTVHLARPRPNPDKVEVDGRSQRRGLPADPIAGYQLRVRERGLRVVRTASLEVRVCWCSTGQRLGVLLSAFLRLGPLQPGRPYGLR